MVWLGQLFLSPLVFFCLPTCFLTHLLGWMLSRDGLARSALCLHVRLRPRNLSQNRTKRCACHALCTSGCRRAAPVTQTQVANCARVRANGPGCETVRQRRQTSQKVTFLFSRFLFSHHTPTHVFSHASILSYLCANLPSTSVPTWKFLLNFL